MNKKITIWMILCVGMAFCAVSAAGQKRADAAATVEIRKARALEKVSTKAPDVRLRAAAQPFPDSTITYDAADRKTEKTVYTYDSDGYETLQEVFEWKNSAWAATSKTVYEYDAAGNQTLHESYDRENGTWVGNTKDTHVFDDKGEEIERVYYDWEDGNSKWAVSETHHYEKRTVNPQVYVCRAEYPDGRREIYLSCFGSGDIRSAAEEYEYESTYDEKGNLTTVETSGLSIYGTRYPNGKYTVEYVNDRPVSVEGYGMNATGAYVLNRRGTYGYDSRGNATLFELYETNSFGELALMDKYAYAYDAAGRLTMVEIYFDLFGNGWIILGVKFVYTYDANGNVLSDEYYSWDDESGSYVRYSKSDYLIDGQGKTVKELLYSWENGKWNFTGYTVSYPNSLPNGGVINEAVAVAEIWSYGDKLHVLTPQPATLKVYALSGALIGQQKLSAGEAIVSLPRGIYLVQVGNAVRKVAIQ